jgi:alkylhydroperoxidase/carboxymuconolactone decarboxylase family protein YurZ
VRLKTTTTIEISPAELVALVQALAAPPAMPTPAPTPAAPPAVPQEATGDGLEAEQERNAEELQQRLQREARGKYLAARGVTARLLVEPWRTASPDQRSALWTALSPVQLGAVDHYLTTHTRGHAQALIDAGATPEQAAHILQIGIALRCIEPPSSPRHYYPQEDRRIQDETQ